MSDFTAEFRQNSMSFDHSGDFVADFKERTGQLTQMPVYSQSQSSYQRQRQSSESNDSDQEVVTLLAISRFTKNKMTELLHNSVLTLVEKILGGHGLASIEGNLSITLHDDCAPIDLNIRELYPKVCTPLADLEHKMNVSYREPLSPSDSWKDQGSSDYMSQSYDSIGNEEYRHGNVCAASPNSSYQIDDDESGYNGNFDARKEESQRIQSKELMRQVSEVSYRTTQDNSKSDETSEIVIDMTEDNSAGRNAHLSESNCRFSEMTSGPDVGHVSASGQTAVVQGVSFPSQDVSHSEYNDVDCVYDDGCMKESYSQNCEMVLSSCYSDDTSTIEAYQMNGTSVGDSDVMSGSDATDHDTDVSIEMIEDPTALHSNTSAPHPKSMVVSTTSGELSCKLCNDSLQSSADVSTHAIDKHSLFVCSVCYITFTAKNNLKRHMRLHNGMKPYKCPHCQLSFARRDDMKGHMLRHNYKKPFRCAVCKKGYTDRACVKNHMAKEHGSKKMQFCPQCGESFDNEEAFSEHKKVHPELQQFACKQCPFIGNNTCTAMKHSLVHDYIMFTCKPCNAFYADPFDYTRHLRTHKGDSEFKNYECCFCEVTLTSYEQFNRHEYTHAQGKLYPCKSCNMQFKNKSAMTEHSKTHSTESIESMPNSYKSIEHGEYVVIVGDDEKVHFSKTAIHAGLNPGALDLTVRRSQTSEVQVVPSPISNASVLGQTQSNSLDNLNFGVPRNGYIPEMSGLGSDLNLQGNDHFGNGYHTYSIRPVELQRNEELARGPQPPANTGVTNTDAPFQRRFVGKMNTTNKICDSPITREALFGTNPYAKNKDMQTKMKDFASKYIAVRGPIAPMIRSQPVDNEKLMSIAKQMFAPSRFEVDANNNNNPTYQNENTLSRQIPTFIKNEPHFDLTENNNVGPDNMYIPQQQTYPKPQTAFSTSVEQPQQLTSAPGYFLASPPTGDTLFECQTCKACYNSFSSLESHSVTTHKLYLCEYCKKSFTTRPNRDRHVRFHTGEKPYKCTLCDKAFPRGDDLKYHRTTRHAAALPYSCSRCPGTFGSRKELDRHLRAGKCT